MIGRVRMVEYFVPPDPVGGAEIQAFAMSEWLRDQGIEAEVIGVAPAGSPAESELARPLRPVGWNGWLDRRVAGHATDYGGLRRFAHFARYDGYLWALHRYLRATAKPGDVVVFSFLSPVSGVGCRACRGLCPTVTEWAGEAGFHLNSFRQTPVRPLGKRLAEWALASDHFIPNFRKGSVELDELGIPRDRQTYVPSGVDTERFAPAEDRLRARADLGIGADDFVVGYVSQLRRTKGQRYAIEAIARAVEAGVPAHLLMVGDGAMREPLLEQAAELGVSTHVTCCGSVADVRAYLQASDVAMLLSETEGPSRAVIEALACGLPVIASDVGGLPDSVTPDETGVLVPDRDSAAAGDALLRLYRDSGLRSTMGAKARAFAVEHRSDEVVWRQFLDVLESTQERWERENPTPTFE